MVEWYVLHQDGALTGLIMSDGPPDTPPGTLARKATPADLVAPALQPEPLGSLTVAVEALTARVAALERRPSFTPKAAPTALAVSDLSPVPTVLAVTLADVRAKVNELVAAVKGTTVLT